LEEVQVWLRKLQCGKDVILKKEFWMWWWSLTLCTTITNHTKLSYIMPARTMSSSLQ